MDFWINHFTGIVADQQQWNDTYVSGGGASGAVAGNMGYAHSRPIKTEIVRNSRFCLVDAAGREQHVHVQNMDFSARAGNTVTAVWAGRKGMAEGSYVALYNHNTGRVEFNLRRIYRLPMNIWLAMLMFLLLAGGWIPGAYSALFITPDDWRAFAAIAGSWLVVNIPFQVWLNRLGRKLDNQVRAYLREVIGESFEKRPAKGR